ncbi:hypothetical protein [Flavobacterium sp. LB2P74]|uniref:hypothetical protein n=1 Tax=Flavobacterium sp. LB2P74 TaxID=3401717 RepID=UPI003AAAEE03
MKNNTLQQFFEALSSKNIFCFSPKNKISSLVFSTLNKSDFNPKPLNNTYVKCLVHESVLKLFGESTFFLLEMYLYF